MCLKCAGTAKPILSNGPHGDSRAWYKCSRGHESPQWTADSVRRELPDVEVRNADGTFTHGQLMGRANDFATIASGDLRCDVAWSTAARSLNEDKPITVA